MRPPNPALPLFMTAKHVRTSTQQFEIIVLYQSKNLLAKSESPKRKCKQRGLRVSYKIPPNQYALRIAFPTDSLGTKNSLAH